MFSLWPLWGWQASRPSKAWADWGHSPHAVRALGATQVILARDIAKGALGTETVDGILDTVAGEFFGAGVAALRPKGTLSLSFWFPAPLEFWCCIISVRHEAGGSCA
jgi:hypothetical protein